MLSKTLIVCLLAFLCLTLATTERLNTRIAGSTTAKKGQFPYIAFLSYNYVDANGASTSQQFTGIIYSTTSVITTANNFDNFPATGATLIVEVGAYDINQPQATFSYAATVGTYDLTAGGTPSTLIIIPTQYVAGEPANNIAIVKLPTPSTFDLTNAEIKIANFPTSRPSQGDSLYVVAYGNQVANGASSPALKYAKLNYMRTSKCQTALAGASPDLSAQFDLASDFCVRSEAIKSGGFYEGVCRNDIGGAVVRVGDPATVDLYYEVLGLISFADDANTCNPSTRVPAVVTYLHYFQETFFTPILGSLETNQNGQDATQNPKASQGLDVCGNGVREGAEQCDFAADSTDPNASCCSKNTCQFKPSGKLCNGAKKSDPTDKCVQKQTCGADGQCLARNKPDGRKCGTGLTCSSGTCA